MKHYLHFLYRAITDFLYKIPCSKASQQDTSLLVQSDNSIRIFLLWCVLLFTAAL